MTERRTWYLLCAALVLLAGCNGGGSETPNSYAGVEIVADNLSISGTGPSCLELTLFGAGYLPHVDSGYISTRTTGNEGTFRFDSLHEGVYSLMAVDSAAGTNAFANAIVVQNGSTQRVCLSLDSPAVVRGHVAVSSDSGDPMLRVLSAIAPSVALYSPGTPWYTRNIGTGLFTIDGYASGTFSLESPLITIIMNHEDTSGTGMQVFSYKIKTSVTLNPGQVLDIDTLHFEKLY
jgi:hypothetical protein